MRSMDFQVTGSTKALGSVSRMVKNGNRVVFDMGPDGSNRSYIEQKDAGEKLWLRERNGVYVLDVYVASPEYEDKNNGQGIIKDFTWPRGR